MDLVLAMAGYGSGLDNSNRLFAPRRRVRRRGVIIPYLIALVLLLGTLLMWLLRVADALMIANDP